MMALIPAPRFSKKSQKQRKATPRFQFWRMKLVQMTSSKRTAESMFAIGYNGYEGSAAAMMSSAHRGAQKTEKVFIAQDQ